MENSEGSRWAPLDFKIAWLSSSERAAEPVEGVDDGEGADAVAVAVQAEFFGVDMLAGGEAEEDRPGVLAVGVENHALNPGEATRVFVIRQREGDE